MDHSHSHSDHDPNLYALSIHFDGGARPNPGIGGCGFVVRRRIVGYSEIVEEGCPVKRFDGSADCQWPEDGSVEEFAGRLTLGDSDCTNNVAEYMSLIIALHAAISTHSTRCSGCQVYVQHYAFIDIFGDSQLVIRQMAGECEIRSKTMQTLHHFASELVKELSRSWTKCAACTATVRFHHISRDLNTEADALACLAITNPTSPLVPWESQLSFIHQDTCTSCAKKRASVDAAAATTAVEPVGKTRRGKRR